MSPTRVIVIGCGWSGLAAAKTYLEIDPTIDLTILDDDTSVGGVWSKSRIYPGLIANSPNGLFEFSDLSMVDAQHPKFQLVPGDQVSSYLEGYAREHDLLRRVKFGRKVVRAVRNASEAARGAGGWRLYTQGGEVWDCDKLMVSAGLFTKPRWPDFCRDTATSSPFKVSMHTKSLGQEHHRLTAPEIQDVVVVGGCKSAVEAACICLDAGKRVHWVVKPSEHGVPIVVVNPAVKPNFVAVSNTRLFAVWSPSVFTAMVGGFWYQFLHSGTWWLGTWLLQFFWFLTDRAIRWMGGGVYTKSENGRMIEPARSAFWNTPYASLLYTDNPFLNWLHDEDKLKVYRGRAVGLNREGLILNTKQVIRADAVVYATGWRPSVDFFEPDEARQLGIPIPLDGQDEAMKDMWKRYEADASKAVTDALAQLRHAPATEDHSEMTRFRMYRQILSPKLLAREDRSISFVGFVANAQTAACGEILALWAVAWMEDLHPAPLPSETEMEKEVSMVNAWMSKRYGASGQREPDIVTEIQSFFDVLMGDLGLQAERKRAASSAFWREWLEPYEACDYKGVVKEFLSKSRIKDKNA